MKLINKFLLVAMLVFAAGACTDDFAEINTDPNEPTSVPSANLLTQAQYAMSEEYWGRAMNFEFGMLMVQHFSQNEYAEDSRYNQGPSNFSGAWATFYAGSLSDITAAMMIAEGEASTESVKANKMAMLKIMRALAFSMITDIWGDVPYSEALSTEFPNPAYDSQESIYMDLVAELDEAMGMIDMGAGSYGGADIIFGGDMASWARFANSLKLRLGMRMADANPSMASTVVSQAAAGDLITSNAQNALFRFGADQLIANPFFVDAITRDDFSMSEPLVSAMQTMGDPRLEMYSNPNINGEIVGIPYGLTDGESFELKLESSRPNDRLRQATEPAVLMGSWEVNFFLAEAAERGLISGNAENYYNTAVTESMGYWNVGDQASAYLSANGYNGMESIAYEKWVALYSNGLEAWAEHRRLDAPALSVPAAAVLDMIPVRGFYPASEEGVNSSFNDVGFNNMTTKMWWDVD
ncbi:MAG: SusD/RagB family nutrient-binding outer membrane lipoprotein [Bacteroidota bacterium]